MPQRLARTGQRLRQWRDGLFGLACVMLSGCNATLLPHNAGASGEVSEPRQQVADYLSTDCDDIWSLSGGTAENNPLYWLRGMDCADRLAAARARAEANSLAADSWQGAFKRGILLANAKIAPAERRQLVSDIDALSPQIPTRIRPLYQVWRDGQALQLSLSEERLRYSKLQETSDGQLDALRLQQQQLQAELDLTTRKLQNLTDIERQLSSRKPGADMSHPAASDEDKHE
ncbi:two-component system QseEF-associated lipoprotein QseG [Kluyvera georgiana]|uniref:two-component system QseEF-associated lipoprotein QseG n=1 Tax=Kluyvera georgiana TaxID=73098 RepID=UPI003F67989A